MGTKKKTPEQIEKAAKATVAKRHKAAEVAEAAANPGVAAAVKEAKVKAAKEASKLPAMPKMPSAARTRKEKAKKPCACGCQTPTTGQWAPGHDARAKGWAIRVERGIVEFKDVPANEQAGAKLMLDARKGIDKANITLAKGNKGKKAEPEAAAEPAAEAVGQ